VSKYFLGLVNTAKLAPRCVTNSKIALNAITTDLLEDGTITNDDVNATANIAHSKIAAPALIGLLRTDTTPTSTSNSVWTTLYTVSLAPIETNRSAIIVIAQVRGEFAFIPPNHVHSTAVRLNCNDVQVGTSIIWYEIAGAGTQFGGSGGGALIIPLIAGVNYTRGEATTITIEGWGTPEIPVSAYYDSSIIFGVD
jgi:hypothetical protein